MPKVRLNQRINITMPPALLERLDAGAAEYDLSRSELIRWAVQAWLEQHPRLAAATGPIADIISPAAEGVGLAAASGERRGRAFREFISADMSPDELLEALKRYEAT